MQTIVFGCMLSTVHTYIAGGYDSIIIVYGLSVDGLRGHLNGSAIPTAQACMEVIDILSKKKWGTLHKPKKCPQKIKEMIVKSTILTMEVIGQWRLICGHFWKSPFT